MNIVLRLVVADSCDMVSIVVSRNVTIVWAPREDEIDAFFQATLKSRDDVIFNVIGTAIPVAEGLDSVPS